MFRTTLTLLALTATLIAQAPPESSSTAGMIPTAIVAGATIPADSTLKIEATHGDHQLTSPTAITFDDQGRIYCSETHRLRKGVEDDRDHLYWYLDDLASKKIADRRALHEKWNHKVPTTSLTQKSEVIRRLADTDGDGKIDESKIFADGYNDVLDGTAAGIFHYEGSLYFACIPKIQMLRDTNDDGVADERKTVEEGFGIRVSLAGHDLSGFTLGPDGRIYGTVGDRGLSLITKEGVSYDYPNQGAAFRFEPDGTGFEIFHSGLRNPGGISFDALGNAFSVDAHSEQGDKARVVYLVEGGDSGWQMEHQAMHTFHHQIGLEKRPPSRWMDEKMWELETPEQPAFMLPPVAHLTNHPSGLTSNPGAGFLTSEAGRFLVCDSHGSAMNSGIWSFAMKEKGAGMEMSDARQFAWGIAATDVEYSWDGKVFISDLVAGKTSPPEGRLLSLDAGDKTWQADEAAGAARIMKEGFEQRSSAVLANLLKHPDARIRLRAQIALTRKPDAHERFINAADSSNFITRIHGIQGLGILSRRGSVPLPSPAFGDIPTAKTRKLAEAKLVALLKDTNPEIRAQSLHALAGSNNSGGSIPLAALLADESPRVRFFAAILIGKLKMIAFYGPVCEMLAENNNRDIYLRHAGIYALQHMASNPNVLTALSGHESPAVRLAATVALRRLKSPAVANFIHDADPQVADEAIRTIGDLDLVSRHPIVAEHLDDLTQRTWTPFMLRRLVHSAFRTGTQENAARILKFAVDPNLPEIVRIEALRLLENWTEPFPVDQLTGTWRPLEKRSLTTIKPLLLEQIPQLLKQDGFVFTAALKMVKHYQLQIPSLDDAALRNFIKDAKLPAEARHAALDLFITSKPKDLDLFLSELTRDTTDEIFLAALAALAKSSPTAALPPLEAAVNSSSIPHSQRAWDILATLPGDAVDAIFMKKLEALRAANGTSPFAIELLAAAKKRDAATVKNAVTAFEKSLADNNDPPAKLNRTLEGTDPAFLKIGKQQFVICSTCHGQGGEGTAAAPPLAGSEWVNGPEENLIRIQLRGLRGPIKVKGLEYNIAGGMAALAYQSDEQIAAVLTYVRSSFGNSASAVSPAAVATLRGEVGKPQLATTDLTPLTSEESVETTGPPPSTTGPGKYDSLATRDSYSSSLLWIALALGGLVLTTLGVIRLKRK